MKNSIWILLALCCLGNVAWAQQGVSIHIDDFKAHAQLQQNMRSKAASLQVVKGSGTAIFLSEPLSVPLQKFHSFLAVSLSWSAPDWDDAHHKIWLRFYNSPTDERLLRIRLDGHRQSDMDKYAGQLQILEEGYRYFQFRIEMPASSKGQLEDLVLRFYDPGNSANPFVAPAANLRGNCDCPQPDFQERDQWCANNNCPEGDGPQETPVTHLIIHHSAGVNTSNDWAAVVRSIWDFHVNTRSWDDIGYNWLIDPEGNIYQGRGDNIRGAHFCGANSNTMGVCMLGTYTTVAPSEETIDALAQLLSWKACDRDIDPLQQLLHPGTNRTLYTISGHRDGCATECPGGAFYPSIADLRLEVADQLDACALTSSLSGQSKTETSLQLSHNPIKEDLYIDLVEENGQANSSIEIFALGSGLKKYERIIKSTNTQIHLQLSDLPSGAYILRLEKAQKVYVKKFIKLN